MSNIYFPATKTPAEWREMARGGRKLAVDSFDRCDTDGFASQAANGLMARLYELCAEIAENGGHDTFTGVTDLDGNLLDAKEVEGRFGWVWLIRNPDGTVAWFNESEARNGERRRMANARKGYKLVECMVPAVVMMGGGGTGMAGMFSCTPITRPMNGEAWTVLSEIKYEDR
jgi:hypothetical protein